MLSCCHFLSGCSHFCHSSYSILFDLFIIEFGLRVSHYPFRFKSPVLLASQASGMSDVTQCLFVYRCLPRILLAVSVKPSLVATMTKSVFISSAPRMVRVQIFHLYFCLKYLQYLGVLEVFSVVPDPVVVWILRFLYLFCFTLTSFLLRQRSCNIGMYATQGLDDCSLVFLEYHAKGKQNYVSNYSLLENNIDNCAHNSYIILFVSFLHLKYVIFRAFYA